MTLVVKFGTSLIATPDGSARRELLRQRAHEIAKANEPVCVVSSGAIALGLPTLGLDRRPRQLPKLQAASALGQGRLQSLWEEAFSSAGLAAAQVLLTASDVADRRSYVNVRNALDELFRLGAVPVVNENDATATDEITFGDNDALAAHVAVLIRARLLVLLTEVDGVFSRLPGGELLTDGGRVNDAVLGNGSSLGRGGMQSKIVAARMAASAGIPTVITSGAGESVLGPIFAGEIRGTRFAPEEVATPSFKLWLRFGKPVAGRIIVDDGAAEAVRRNGASLLAVGIVDCDGAFSAGDAVELAGSDGVPFGKGIVSIGSDELAGRRHGMQAVHRDRLILY
jgi:glutamate 5-kinase